MYNRWSKDDGSVTPLDYTGKMRAPAASVLALFALAAAAAIAAGPAEADTVRLKRGPVIKGKVIDRGAYVIVERDFPYATTGAAVPTGTASVSIRIERHEIQSIEIDGQAAQTPKDLDIVVFVSGDELPGRVEVREDGKEVVVRGEGDRGEVVFDSRQVRTILWSQKAKGEQRTGMTSLGSTVEKLLLDLRSTDDTARREARKKLYGLGVYALPYLEARQDDSDPAIRDAVRGVVEIARFRTYMTPELADRVPSLARVLVEGTEPERVAVLKEAVVAAPNDCAPILLHLARHDRSKDVRAFVLGQLTLLDRIPELLELVESRDGSLRFAAAVALGDNGVFVGVPLVIEGLKHPEVSIRKVSIQKLETWFGEFKGYFPDVELEKRAAAVAKWEEFWAKEGAERSLRSLRSTIRKDEISEEEKGRGILHWTNAQKIWDAAATTGLEGEARKRELYKVRFALEKSLEHYPQNANARNALGTLLYTELDEPGGARRELDLVLHRYADDAAPAARLHAHFHLGRIAQSERRWTEAESHYKLALSIDQRNVDALRALGLLAYERAITDERLDKEARKKGLDESIRHYTAAMTAVDQYDMELRENVGAAADAIAVVQPFRRGIFMKSVDAVKLELRRTAADLRYLRGRSYGAVQNRPLAFADSSAALELDPENPLYRGAVEAWRPEPAPPAPATAPKR